MKRVWPEKPSWKRRIALLIIGAAVCVQIYIFYLLALAIQASGRWP